MLPTRTLGTQGLRVPVLGLGLMGMSHAYGTAEERDERESIATIHRAIELGCTFLDTAEAYGPYKSEELLARALKELKGGRDRVVIATKFGFKFDASGGIAGLDSRPAHIREAVENTLRRAHAVHPISALQSEYSLWERNLEPRIIPLLRELGIGLVPFAPLGRGFLTGSVKRAEEYPAGDYRRGDPRYRGANFDANMQAGESVRELAARKAVTAGQIALAWLLHKGDDVVPIPGTKRRKYLEENIRAADVVLAPDDLRQLAAVAPLGVAAGTRYPEGGMRTING